MFPVQLPSRSVETPAQPIPAAARPHQNNAHGEHRKTGGLQHVAAEATLQQQAHHADRNPEPHQRCGQAGGQGFMPTARPEANQKRGHKLQQKPKHRHIQLMA